jgi:hypothetical protein
MSALVSPRVDLVLDLGDDSGALPGDYRFGTPRLPIAATRFDIRL